MEPKWPGSFDWSLDHLFWRGSKKLQIEVIFVRIGPIRGSSFYFKQFDLEIIPFATKIRLEYFHENIYECQFSKNKRHKFHQNAQQNSENKNLVKTHASDLRISELEEKLAKVFFGYNVMLSRRWFRNPKQPPNMYETL